MPNKHHAYYWRHHEAILQRRCAARCARGIGPRKRLTPEERMERIRERAHRRNIEKRAERTAYFRGYRARRRHDEVFKAQRRAYAKAYRERLKAEKEKNNDCIR